MIDFDTMGLKQIYCIILLQDISTGGH